MRRAYHLAAAAALATTLASAAPLPARAGGDLDAILAAWRYPDAAVRSSGGGGASNPRVEVKKVQALMTTADPVDDVVAYYRKKLQVDDAGQVARAEARDDDASAVSIQDDSQGRRLTLKVIAWHRGDEAGTIAISRAEGEAETHIALSFYSRAEAAR